jgi:hypothetical protein
MLQRKMGFTELLAEYKTRDPQFGGNELERRRLEFQSAFGMNRLEGAGIASEEETQAAELWMTGRISDSEYIELCALTLTQNHTVSSPKVGG